MAISIGAITLYFSNTLAKEIAKEEKKKVAIWANASRQLNDPDIEGDLTFQLDVIKSNTTIPAFIVDENGKIMAHINLDPKKSKDTAFLAKRLNQFKTENEPIVVPLTDKIKHKVYYGDSHILVRIRNYPFYALALVFLFVIVSYFAFSFSRRAEENRVWVGLAKETAHQLGTPISSLMGWIQFLELELGKLPNDAVVEMEKDIDRLKVITQRFSKIGSAPELEIIDANAEVSEVMNYMTIRFGRNVDIILNLENEPAMVALNKNLFHWVIENLVKNSIDAMQGQGQITCRTRTYGRKFIVDIEDNGSGIPSNRFKTIFKPGFTTKKRGWGLGLSLAHRIVRQYHKGDIFVKSSVPKKKTVIRVALKLA
jgi:two-component sensor histidine kinase